MAVNVTYPGVYVQEIPSAVHTIVGVPTSVAAFVGAASRGPMDTAVRVDSWAAYARSFGGLDDAYPMSWAVYLYFLNGGAVAEVVRAGVGGAPAEVDLKNGYTLVAASPGAWGNKLEVTVDHDETGGKSGVFNLTVREKVGTVVTATELWRLLSADNVEETLKRSALVRLKTDDDAGAAARGAKKVAPSEGGGGRDGGGQAKDSTAVADVTEGTFSHGRDPSLAPPPKDEQAAKEQKDDKDQEAEKAPWDVVGGATAQAAGRGIYALASVDIVNMLCLPTPVDATWTNEELAGAVDFCSQHRAVLIVDPPKDWDPQPLTYEKISAAPAVPASGVTASSAAVYYPNLVVGGTSGREKVVGPCGAVAGVWASTDASRGFWKAPAGTAAGVRGISRLNAVVNDDSSGVLNRLAVNALRDKPLFGPVVWGARTAAGADANSSEWKYLPVRRTALYIEESLRRATQWVVFEPNDEPLWSSLRLNVGVFMHSTWRAGAFQGSTPAEAYFVKCDKDVNPQDQVDLGIVNILVGFAPLKPAEFVVISIQQLAGQLAV